MSTPSEIVTTLDNAIVAIASGAQSYEVMGRKVTRANLSELMKTRDYYSKIAANQGTDGDSGRNYAVLGTLSGMCDSVTSSDCDCS